MDQRIEQYLNTNIKDIINQYAPVQTVLDKFEIGCAPCSVGTCKLKDIIEIHNLDEAQEKMMLTEIFGIIYPGETFALPRIGSEKKAEQTTLSPSLRQLVDEHDLIKRVLALIPSIAGQLDVAKPEHQQLLRGVTDFIRNFADKFHHAKEEDILFAYFDANLDIIKVMLTDHVNGRMFVANILKAIETQDNELAKTNLLNYANLLTDHIRKEDTILYPWMDKSFDTRTVGELYSRFAAVESSMKGLREQYTAFVERLEKQFAV